MERKDNEAGKIPAVIRKDRQLRYTGKIIKIYDDTVIANGHETHWDFIHHDGAAAVVAIVATVALRLTSMTSGGNGDDAVLCSVETVEQSAPLSVVLASMTDDQLADVSYYSTDDIPEY